MCFDEEDKLLMVFQGKAWEKNAWAVPSGGQKDGETLEGCCVREVQEETGYLVRVKRKLQVKNITYGHISAQVHYFLVDKAGEKKEINDPDKVIHDVRWIGIEELQELSLGFPEDREFLLNLIKAQQGR